MKTRKPGRRASQSKRRSFFAPEQLHSPKRRARALRVEQLEDRRVLATQLIHPGFVDGWQFTASDGDINPPPPSVQFENGPATPPIGTGSLEFRISAAGSDAAQARLPNYAGTLLSDIQDLSYSTYVDQNNGGLPGNGGQAPYIILNVDYDNNGSIDDLLFFEPLYQDASFFPSNPQGPLALDTWQTWDALDGGWYSVFGTAGSGPGANVKPFNTFFTPALGGDADATIVNSSPSGLGGLRFVTGFGGPADWGNFIGNIDNVTVNTTATTSTTFDFELSSQVSLTGSDQDDILEIKSIGPGAASYQLTTNGVPGPVVIFNTLQAFFWDARGGNDLLIVDSTNGLVEVTDGIRYLGGTGFDQLDLVQTGGDQRDSSSLFVGANPGDGQSIITDGASTQRVDFQELEPVNDNVPAATFTLSSTPAIASLLDAANAINYVAGVTNGPTWGRITVDNFEPIEFTNKTTLVIDAGAGSDEINLNNPNTPTGLTGITADGGDPTASDTLIVNGVAGVANNFTVVPTGVGAGTITDPPSVPVTFTTIEHLTMVGQSADADSLNLGGTAVDDTISLTPGPSIDSGTATGFNVGAGAFNFVPLTYTGFRRFLAFPETPVVGGLDTLIVNGTDADDLFIYRDSIPFAGDPIIQVNGSPEIFSRAQTWILRGLSGNDTFNVDLDPAATQPQYTPDTLRIEGGDSDPSSDTITYTATPGGGVVTIDNALQTITQGANPPVSFAGVETLNVNGSEDVADAFAVINYGALTSLQNIGLNAGDAGGADEVDTIDINATTLSNDTYRYTPETRFTSTMTRAEGGPTIKISGFRGHNSPGVLSVAGGTGGEDRMEVYGLNSPDAFVVQRTSPSQTLVEVTLSAGTGNDEPGIPVDFSNIESLVVLGGVGNDALTVAQGAGGLINLAGGVTFHGQSGIDSLSLTGATAVFATYTVGPNPDEGSITHLAGIDTQRVNFTGLEPVVDAVPGPLTINATNGDNAINYSQGGVATNGRVSVDGFEAYEFTNKSLLTINALAGSDTINLNNPTTPTGLTAITVNGGDPTASDVLTINSVAGIAENVELGMTGEGAGVVETSAQPAANFTGIEHLNLVLQLGDLDDIRIDGTAGNDRFEFTPGATSGSGTFNGTLNSGAFNLVPTSFVGMDVLTDDVDLNFLATAVGAVGGVDQLIVNGTAANDVFDVFDSGGSDLGVQLVIAGQRFANLDFNNDGNESAVIRGHNGDDVFNHGAGIDLAVSYEGGNPSASDVLNFNGTGANITIDLQNQTIQEVGFGPVSISGIEHLNVDGANTGAVTVQGLAGVDAFTVTPTGGASAQITDAGVNTVINVNNVAGLTVNGNDGVVPTNSLTVNASQVDNIIGVDDNSVDVTGLLSVAYVDIQSLTVNGQAGSDTFNVTPAAATSIFIDGGDPIGALPGDQINIAGPVTFNAGPENDEGSLTSAGNQPVSFDHIETINVAGPAPAVVFGTNGDDDITIIARDASTHPLADGIQDFTVSVNGGTEILFLNAPTLDVFALSGDDKIVVIAPAPNLAIWDVDVNIDGGAPNASDQVEVGTPGADIVVYTPTGLGTGTLAITNLSSTVTLTAGVEHLVYDGLGGGDSLTVNSPAINGTQVLTPFTAFDEGLLEFQNNALASFIATPLKFEGLGTGGSLTLADAVRNDNLIYRGTDLDDTFSVDAAGQVLLNNRIPVNTPSIVTLTLAGLDGDDTFNIAGNHNLPAINVEGGNPSASDVLNFNAAVAGGLVTLDYDLETVVQGAGGPVSFSGVELVEIDAVGNAVDINGTLDDDSFTARPNDATGALVELEGHNTKVQVNNTLDLEIDGDNGVGVENKVTVVATPGNDLITVTEIAGQTQIAIAGSLPILLADIQEAIVSGEGGDDDLTANVAGIGLLAQPLIFHGGQGADSLSVIGAPSVAVDTVTYRPGPTNDAGRLEYDTVDVGVAPNMVIEFTGLEPVVDLVPAASLVVVGTNGNNAINYTQGTVATNGLVSVDAFETIEFSNKVNLTINALAGSDTINLNNPSTPTGLTSITVNGGDPTGSDTVIINGTAGADTIDVTVVDHNSADVNVNASPTIDVDDVELLKIVGGNTGLASDTINYEGIVGGDNRIVFTPGNVPDAGTITGFDFFGGGPSHLPVEFSNIGSSGALDIDSNSGFGSDVLVINGTAGNDVVSVTGADGDIQLTTPNAGPHVPITTTAFATLLIETFAGDDVINIGPGVTAYDEITVNAGSPSASDTLNYTGAGGIITVETEVTVGTDVQSITEAGAPTPVFFTGVEHLNVDAAGASTVEINGTADDDFFTVRPTTATSAEVTIDGINTVYGVTGVLVGGVVELDGDNGVGFENSVTFIATEGSDTISVVPNAGGVNVLMTGRLEVRAVDVRRAAVEGRDGSDTFNVTPSPLTSIFIDGGDPIGVLPGDVLNVVGGGAATFHPGPESDEGGFSTVGNQDISFDHIESVGAIGPGGFIINGTNGNDVITIIARDGSTHAGADGIQDFTVSVNGGPSVLFLDTPVVTVNALAGDDVITVRTPAPNDALWGVVVNIDGGEAPPSVSGEQDEVRIETPYVGDETALYVPTGLYSGFVLIGDLGTLINMTDVFAASYDGFQDGDDLTVATANAVITPGSDPGSGVIHPVDALGNPLLDLTYRNVSGVGSSVTVSGSTAVVQGTDENDIITVDAAGIVTVTNELGFNNTFDASLFDNLVINALGGDDQITVAADAPFLTINVIGGANGDGSDELNYDGAAGLGLITVETDLKTITQTGQAVVSFDGIEDLNIDAAGNPVDINGSLDDDTFIVRPNDATGAEVRQEGLNTVIQVNNTLDLEIDGDNGLGVENKITVVGTPGNDDITVTEVAGQTQVAIAGRLPILIADMQEVIVSGEGGDDELTVDVTGIGLLAQPLIFHGGQGADLLTVTGTPSVTVDTVTYNPGPTNDAGRLEYDTNDVGTAPNMIIEFTGLEPVVDLVPAASLVVNGTNANNAINYSFGSSNGVTTGLVSVDAFESIEFANKTTLVLNGLAGSDTINLNNASTPTGLTGITVNGGDPTANTDVVIVNGTAGVNAIVVDLLTNDGGRVTGAQPVPVTVDTTENLTINGQGGADTLTVITPAGGHIIDLTPGALAGEGAIAMREFTGIGGNPLVKLAFTGISANGALTFADVGGVRVDDLTINGTAASNIFGVDAAGLVTLDTLAAGGTTNRTLIPVSTPGVNFLELLGHDGDDEFNVVGNHPFVGGIVADGGNPGASDVLNFTASAGGIVTVNLATETVTQTGSGPVTFSGIETIDLVAGGGAATTTIVATADDDDLTVTAFSATAGQIEVGLAVQQNGQVAPEIVAPLINYSNLGTPGLAVDMAGGEDTLVVVGNALSQTFIVNAGLLPFDPPPPGGLIAPPSSVVIDDGNNGTSDGLITYTGNESLEVFGLEGSDTFFVNAGTIPVFIDGGDPIGTPPGDSIVVFGAIGLVFEGPEVDEGGFITAPGGAISFDHIESLVVAPGPCPFLILGTNADDDITVIARDASYIIPPALPPVGLDGVQDFTVTVNAGPEVLFINQPDLFIDALAGDDDIVIRAPAPNDADWAVEVRVAGGTPATGAPNEGDRLVVETPGIDIVEFRPTGPETGSIVINENGVPDFQDATGDSVVIFGPFVFICDDPVGPPIEFIYNSSPGGVELVEYDGLDNEADPAPPGPAGDIVDNADDVITIFGTAGNDTTTVSPTGTVGIGLGSGSFISDLSPIFNFVSFEDLTVNGGGGFDHVIYNATEGPDVLTASGTNGITLGDATVTMDAAIEKLTVNTFGGDDNINIDITIGLIAKTVDAGAGNDIVDLAGSDDADIFGGIGNDILIGTPATDNIFGGPGNDVLIGAGGVDNLYGEEGNDILGNPSAVGNGIADDPGNDFFFGGDGSDTFLWEPGDGSDTIEGGDGTSDVLIFIGAAAVNDSFQLSAIATTRLRAIRSPGAITLDTADVEIVNLNGLTGSDSFLVQDLYPTAVQVVNADFGVDADTDTVTIHGRDVSDQVNISGVGTLVEVTGLRYDVFVHDATLGSDEFTFNANGGNDNVVAADSVSAFFTSTNSLVTNDFRITGGDGDDFLAGYGRLSGNAGNDTLVGSPTLVGVLANQIIEGGDGDDFISGGRGADFLFGEAGEDTFVTEDADDATDTVDGGIGFDTILIQATSGNDRIDVEQDSPVQLRYEVSGIAGDGILGGAGTETDNLVAATVEEVEIVAGSGDDTIRVAHDDTLLVAPGIAINLVRFTVDGGLPGASDRLTVTDQGIGDTTVQRIGGIPGDGSFTMYAFTGGVIGAPIIPLPPVVYTGIEFASLNPIGPITGGTGQVAPFGRLFVFKHDPHEANNTLHEATFLGANQTTNVDPTIDPGVDPIGGPGFGLPGDEDWYRIVAETNGTLDIQVYFDQYAGNGVRAGLPSEGNLEIAVYDVDGLIGVVPAPGAIAGTGAFGTNDITDDERIRIPAVAGQTYYLRVVGAPLPVGDLENTSAAINVYNISVVNTPAAVPFDLELDDIIGVATVDAAPVPTATTFEATGLAPFVLSTVDNFYNGKDIVFTSGNLNGQRGRIFDYVGATQTFVFTAGTFAAPPAAGSSFQIESADTGRSQFDNITRDTTPTIFIRVPDVINVAGVATLDDLPYNGSAPGNPPDEFIGIPHIPSLLVDVPTPSAGFRVPVFITEHGTSDQGPPNNVLAGYAQPVDPVNRPGLFSFTFGSAGSLIPELPVFPGTSETTSFFISARLEMIDPAQNINPGAPPPADNQEQAQGYGAFSQSLEIVVDTQEPPVFFGLPNDPDDGLLPGSDTGVSPTNPDTLTDLITSDTTPGFFGQAEADAVIRLFVDAPELGFPTGDGIFEPGIDFQVGFDVAEPFDGTNQYPNGFWQIDSITVDLNGAPFDPVDGLRRFFLTAEDVAGNINDAPFQLVTDVIEIFVDTQGPQITDVEINEEGNPYDLFDPKPSNDGPTPLVNSIVLSVRDLPLRAPPGFDAPAIKEDIAEHPGHYLVTGDHNGIIPILFVDVVNDPVPNPAPEPGDSPLLATATIEIFFRLPGPDGVFDTSDDIGRALPDDRFTLFVNEDGILDLAGNRLDGESNADEPHDQDVPFPTIRGVDGVPSGDGLPGGDFIARFTVDSRPELALWAGGSVWVDANGNNRFDSENGDFTNRDFAFVFGYTSDDLFAGQFAANVDNPLTPENETISDGFDKVGAYGRVGTTTFRWQIDTNNDGVPDIEVLDPSNVNGTPVAGNFGAFSGDEVGVFTGTVWHFDTNHNFDVDTTINWPVAGYPIVGDFDGDGFDDLATYVDDVFSVDLSSVGAAGPVAALNNAGLGTGVNGTIDRTFKFGFIGVGERPICADMNQDGIEDLGLWVPARDGVTPNEEAEWYFLLSGVTANNTRPSGVGQPDIGDPIGPTITGTGDPTPGSYLVSASGFYQIPGSLDNPDYFDGRIVTDPLTPGGNIVRYDPTPFGNDLYMQFGDQFALPLVGNFDPPVGTAGNGNTPTNPGNPLDVNNDGFVSPIDALIVINHLNANNGTTAVPTSGFISAPFKDVNHDGYVSPIDALLVINHLNNAANGAAGEGEAADAYFGELGEGEGEDANDALLSVLASDAANQRKKK